MHHADQQRADWQAPGVIMLVHRRIVLTRFSLVGVGMNMGHALSLKRQTVFLRDENVENSTKESYNYGRDN